MGCHTWYYTKIERTQEEATEVCLRVLRRARNSWWKSFKYWEDGVEWYRLCYEIILSEREYKNNCFKHVNILNRQIRMVSNGYCKRAVWNNQDGFMGAMTEYVDGVGLFMEVDDFHDGFRVHDYPDIHLLSLQETLDYIESRGEQCQSYEYTLDILVEFWNKYPNGMICFG